MNKKMIPIRIIIADDDEEDRMLIREALSEARVLNPVVEVENGKELMEFLNSEINEKSSIDNCKTGLILLDLNMPIMDGREAIEQLKSHKIFRKIPTVVLTTSKAEEDILKTYDIGVSSFITKPGTYSDYIEIFRVLGNYWFNIVELPIQDIKV